MKRQLLKGFYSGTQYWPSNGRALRPAERHVPLELWEQLKHLEGNDLAELCTGNKLIVGINPEVCKSWAPIFVHESLFHFYKAFYNYLAARLLYSGGMLPWLEVTTYYAKLYLARSLTTLVGKQTYVVDPRQHFYLHQVAAALDRVKGGNPSPYRLRLEVDLASGAASVTFDRGRVSAHRTIWSDYANIGIEELDIFNLLHGLSGDVDHLIQKRNEENYSFEGYMQLDFNLDMRGFSQFFARDFLKGDANRLYDMATGEVLLAFSRQYDLFQSLGIKDLPLELEKFEYMISYCLPATASRDNLIRLCREGFPTRGLWSNDGDNFYDDQQRVL